MYKVFVRNFWRDNPSWPNGLEPHPRARKHTLGRYLSEEDARDACQKYNKTHKPGRYSRKAEYIEEE